MNTQKIDISSSFSLHAPYICSPIQEFDAFEGVTSNPFPSIKPALGSTLMGFLTLSDPGLIDCGCLDPGRRLGDQKVYEAHNVKSISHIETKFGGLTKIYKPISWFI